MINLNLTFTSLKQLKNYEDNFLRAKKLKTHAFVFVSLEKLKNKYTSLFFLQALKNSKYMNLISWKLKTLKKHEYKFCKLKNA